MTTHAKTLTPDLGSRFSFDAQGEPLSGSYEATPMEMAAAFAAISRTQVHRRSYEMAAPPCHIDRNLFTRILVAAYAVEKASYSTGPGTSTVVCSAISRSRCCWR